MVSQEEAEGLVQSAAGLSEDQFDFEQVIAEMEREMELAARNLQFERAAVLRDQVARLREKGIAGLAAAVPKHSDRKQTKKWKRI